MLFTSLLPFLAIFTLPIFGSPIAGDERRLVKKDCDKRQLATTANTAPAGDSATLLKLHNDFRLKYGAKGLAWNATLATFAKNYGSRCKFAHSGGPYGENLAAGVGGGYTVTTGFNSWANEAAKYNWNAPGFSAATGHFTAVVWKATTQVGCAAVQCQDGTIFSGMGGRASTYVLCEYMRPGNVVGNNNQYFRDNVGTLQP